ncbi:LamG-like jellyroll fold domain-containing protein [Parvicella tangerina]|uniref:Secretion system C-terminal sorting domain-containing protein n=1 Tax=Parvicella tangerina TaxID=2829795 RepID=A0A916JMV4_9FLAO|nr:LamG-like jellyroll fold domain-containing protein [Parvicella tangerina]CAG5083572.1 hypothetical protein CRYO30217_02233 [Parvicella tangerina]
MKTISTLLAFLILSNLLSAQCLPVADYPFTGNANDISGNGYDATVYGATLTTDRFGNLNSAYEFDGTNDYIDTETSFDYEERTISMWAMVYDTSVNRVVFSQDANTLNYGRASVAFNPGFGIRASAGGETAQQVYSQPNLNEWYHIVLVRNSTATKVYVNGNLVQTGTSGTLGSSFDPNPETVIGVHRSVSQDFFFGKIDDIKIFDCELSDTEIDSLYVLGSNQGPCIVADYPFTGNANDISGNGYDATVYGATLTTDRFGNPNSAYEFDGTNDYIDTETSFDYEERTISMWAMVYDTSVNRVVFSQDANTLNYGRASVAFNPGFGIRASAGGEAAQQVYSQPNLNEWYHIVLVRNTTTTKVYVNGNLVQTSTSGTLGSSFDPNPETVIGVHRSVSQDFFFGKIDDIKIFDCELSDTEIDSLYGDYDIYLGSEIQNSSNFRVYPNPMSRFTTISFSESIKTPYAITLFDQQGRIVRKIDHIQENEITINRVGLSSGVYYIHLSTEGQTPSVSKLIIE